jgi:hypothetical protein
VIALRQRALTNSAFHEPIIKEKRMNRLVMKLMFITAFAVSSCTQSGTTGPEGPEGAEGPEGPPGETGPRGAVGPRGETGAQGPQGERGPIGNPGATGATGATGAQGPVGPAGSMGPQGLQGPAGPTGATGVAGPTGAQGLQGDAGPAGPQGVAGPAGAQGPAGPVGTALYAQPFDGGTRYPVLGYILSDNQVLGAGVYDQAVLLETSVSSAGAKAIVPRRLYDGQVLRNVSVYYNGPTCDKPLMTAPELAQAWLEVPSDGTVYVAGQMVIGSRPCITPTGQAQGCVGFFRVTGVRASPYPGSYAVASTASTLCSSISSQLPNAYEVTELGRSPALLGRLQVVPWSP